MKKTTALTTRVFAAVASASVDAMINQVPAAVESEHFIRLFMEE